MEETNAMQQEVETETRASDPAILLTHFIENNAESFMGILRGYVSKSTLVSDNYDELQEAALEVLPEVYIEAIKTATHFDPARSPKPWLLGIAQKVVMRRRAELLKRRLHEITMSELENERKKHAPDEDPLEQIDTLVREKLEPRPEYQVEDMVQIEYLLSLVSEPYRKVLHLTYLEDKDGAALAESLGCSYDAALVRLHRARKQLRVALEKQRGESNG
ncbi:MAG: sigma-70 family RNA polymerase sigma factor [Chloroflexi bacterium]|nr:MAG: sigma-70 family RNA polymerase sigma factor [Chloroflexota bacterium]